MTDNQPAKMSIKKTALNLGMETIIRSAPLLAHSRPLRQALIQSGVRFSQSMYGANPNLPPMIGGVARDRRLFGDAIVHTIDRVLERQLSYASLHRISQNLLVDNFMEWGTRTTGSPFYREHQDYPPSFLTISPGKACNLRCTGCYANAGPNSEKLDWQTFDRIVSEAKTQWGVRFLVISGGEPLAYRSDGKGLLDIAEKHPDIFFLFYTNGTLINEPTARRIAQLGNITPAISVEGWRKKTDERRGAGVFDKIILAMQRLRNAGVFYGISLTATLDNLNEIFSDPFLDFFFDECGAYYGWIFHYMPIGRSYTLDLMPTPKQRTWMWKRSWEIVQKRKLFIADFWNHGTLSDGCLAGGKARGGGYFYIDWNGAVSPCVFVPYSPVNIKDIYAKGGTLNDIWKEPFFADIRGWQEDYRQKNGNWLAPCINRDHHDVMQRLLTRHEPDPTDENAQMAFLDAEYDQGLQKYGSQYAKLSDPLWLEHYLNE